MIRVVRIGDPRARGEGVRLGTVRLLPRGVRKEEYSKRNLFDVWAPAVSPTRELVAYAQAKPWTDARWAAYRKRYLREMQRPEAQRAIELLAALGKQTNFSICCYCETRTAVTDRFWASCCASAARRWSFRIPLARR